MNKLIHVYILSMSFFAASAMAQMQSCRSGELIFFGNNVLLYNNDWGDNSRNQCIEILDSANLAWQVSWDSGIGNQYNYPALLLGNHGWNVSSGDARFPIKIKDIRTFNSGWDTTTVFADNDNGNVAYDIWLSESSDNWDRHDLEVMIWLNRWRQTPRGGQPSITDAYINNQFYDIYLAKNPSTITFVLKDGTNSLPLLRLKHFINFIYRRDDLNNELGIDVTEEWYLHGVEAGFEYKNTIAESGRYWARTNSFELRLTSDSIVE